MTDLNPTDGDTFSAIEMMHRGCRFQEKSHPRSNTNWRCTSRDALAHQDHEPCVDGEYNVLGCATLNAVVRSKEALALNRIVVTGECPEYRRRRRCEHLPRQRHQSCGSYGTLRARTMIGHSLRIIDILRRAYQLHGGRRVPSWDGNRADSKRSVRHVQIVSIRRSSARNTVMGQQIDRNAGFTHSERVSERVEVTLFVPSSLRGVWAE